MKAEILNDQGAVEVSARQVRRVLRTALRLEGRDAELSVALVGDRQMRRLNRRFLGRRGTTDVIAFLYESGGGRVNGEIVANGELAARRAAGRSHGACDELMLYVVHGLLHLFGYDDQTPVETRRMRWREQAILSAAGRSVELGD